MKKGLDKKGIIALSKRLQIVEVVLEPATETEEEVVVFIREMTGRARDNYESSLYSVATGADGKPDIQANTRDHRTKLAAATLCDEKGNLLFTPQDIDVLSENIPIKYLEKIVEEARKINKMDEEDKEELVKNLEAGVSESSNSGSVEN